MQSVAAIQFFQNKHIYGFTIRFFIHAKNNSS